jgi:hypothetical protein
MYTTNLFKNPSFFVKYFKIKKPFSLNAKGLGISKLPLLDTFRTFKGNMTSENIRLNQLILQY